MAPESNHTSMRSGSRYMGLPVALTNTTSSTNGLCKSNSFGRAFIRPALTDLSTSRLSSSSEPMQISSLPDRLLQIGKGVPQKRDLDKFQSTRFSSQLPNLPVPVDSGFQFTVLFNSTIRSFT